MVLDVRSRPDSTLPSDHFPVEATIRTRLAKAGREKGPLESWDFKAEPL